MSYVSARFWRKVSRTDDNGKIHRVVVNARWLYKVLHINTGSAAGLFPRRNCRNRKKNRSVFKKYYMEEEEQHAFLGSLFPHQLKVVEQAVSSTWDTLVLNMSFGTGKTLTALFMSVEVLKPVGNVVYLAPAQLVPNVQRELWKFGGSIWAGKVRVCSSLTQISPDLKSVLVVDEYHWWTKRKKQLPEIKRKGWMRVILLSGSPSERGEFDPFICSFGEKTKYLQHMDVGDRVLTQPDLRLISLDLDKDQEVEYQKMKASAGRFSQLQKDRCVLSFWKVRHVADAIQKIDPGLKCVVFSEFSPVLSHLWDTLSREASNRKLFRVFLSSPKQRVRQVEDFQRLHNNQGAVALCSSNVASHGLNLGGADVLMVIESPYSRRTMLQIIGRMTRIGQKKNQKVYFWVFRQTLETHLIKANTLQFS